MGDVIVSLLTDPEITTFKFAVAYMRMSGIGRLATGLEALLKRGGIVSGSVGIDDGITSVEALGALCSFSATSTVLFTASSFIYHPKLYLFCGPKAGHVVIGSPNLTRDGLYRNFEIATHIVFDLTDLGDKAAFGKYIKVMSELLNSKHANVQLLDGKLIAKLLGHSLIEPEARVPEPGSSLKLGTKKAASSAAISSMFPHVSIPVPPPPTGGIAIVGGGVKGGASKPATPAQPTATAAIGSATFVMQLSAFDSSHRTGVPGTPEILIPKDAISFFPAIQPGARKYPDANFPVLLNTPTGPEQHSYRLWYYGTRATGTTIDEHRLRMNHRTIDLSTIGGGDLLSITKLPSGSSPEYEVTVLPSSDPNYPAILGKCTKQSQGKRWGII